MAVKKGLPVGNGGKKQVPPTRKGTGNAKKK